VNPHAILSAFQSQWPRSTRARVTVLAAAVVALVALIALAMMVGRPSAPASSGAVELGRPESSGFPIGIDIGAKLAAVLLLIYATAALARRYLLKVPTAPRGVVHLLDSTTIAPKASIYVVEVAGRVLVLGATEAGMQTLTQFDDPETVAGLLENTKPSPTGFQRYLEASLGQPGATRPSGQPLDLISQAAARLRTGSIR
jgi:flagellar biogenesis protein FliO